ncbi:hypothetical protein HK414_05880 [Ramlibacter terrae]|uniref:Uncharacterized protein n=1 Tax=Ramlibacter terrae TaxID=2732511 RepID=A0ABX6P300_9BURK|nr:hypothetical protein HK414_05880 [Ramlibacter terrae]
MSDASDKLARSRQAIVAHIARRERRHDPHESSARPAGSAFDAADYDNYEEPPPPPGEGWFGHLRYAMGTGGATTRPTWRSNSHRR